MTASIIREDDDLLAESRISIGNLRESEDFYFVFRGHPQKVIFLLERILPIVKKALIAGEYEDHRRMI